MAYILALDQGTTSSRAILFDQAGAIAAVAQHEFEQFFPQAGWVEHDPMEILTSQMSLRRRGAGQACGPAHGQVFVRGVEGRGRHRHHQPARDGDCVGAGDGQADSSGHRLAGPPDRCAVQRSWRRAGLGRRSPAKTGLVLDPYFSATKVGWILDNVPGARARAERGELAFGTVDSWLIWHLTSGAAARDGRDQRLADAALQHRQGRVGRGAAAHLWRSCRACCRRLSGRARRWAR